MRGSLMATARGLIAVDRWAMGELATPDGDETMAELLARTAPSPAEDHLRRLCAGCHLGARRDDRDDAVVGIGSGCGACHGGPRTPGAAHRPVDGKVGDERCLGCHSRSGRISLAYQGLAEVDAARPSGCGAAVALFDGRSGCAMPADVHQRAGLACVDCHLHSELMGDGLAHRHAAEAVEVTCQSCHGPVAPDGETTWARVDDAITRDRLRQLGEARPDGERVRLGRRGTPLWNLRPGPEPGAWQLVGKLDGARHAVRPTPSDAAHRQAGHERLTCSACHSTWAPRCATCHTRFEPGEAQWDFGRAALAPGSWLESHEQLDVGPPSLGVDDAGHIGPAVPGMLADLDARAAGGPRRDLRLYAPIAPHTTGAARGCASCHADARALGLGSARLALAPDGVALEPARPDDRWVDLFAAAAPGTRRNARSLDPDEQRRALRVGYCLGCHAAGDALWLAFDDALARLREGRAPTCRGAFGAWMSAR
ncbi:MAG: hypothetical protein U1F43_03350 [Myxococcota bacterium]